MIQLAEAEATGGYREFAENVVLASLASILVGLGFNPKLGALAFTVFMNLKLGETFFDAFRGLGEKWDNFFKELTGYTPDELGELIHNRLYGPPAEVDYPLQPAWQWTFTTKPGQGPLDLYRNYYSEVYPTMREFEEAIKALNPQVGDPFTFENLGKKLWLPPLPQKEYVSDFKGLIRQIASSPEFDDLRAKLSEWNIVLEDFLVKLAESESGLKDMVNWAGGARRVSDDA